MNRVIAVAAFLLLLGAALWVFVYDGGSGGIGLKSDLIRVTDPRPDSVVQSPLMLRGEARGYWYFEASFPVKIVDENGTVLGMVPAQAQGEWMTEEFVPFKAVLEFDDPKGKKGFLIFEKDNPSGLPENADELRIPVRF